ncbi:HNH endonuclease [Spirosoma terrae]|uniref:Putative HNH nuclease YajD n=1 Tax=Spirosoma terrae TaxID=1968276 RepID=A0A6L9LBG2_9BACT|nr:HNH endonuclease signature motif containing protein [Spirosoma terrae]NDU96867.1 HNH endonuclease [Spirosoma terrae]
MPIIHKVTRPWIQSKTTKPKVDTNANRDVYNTRRHQKERAAYLKDNPLCAECQKTGKVTPATVFDHITPINQGGDKWDLSNKQGLCSSCHARKRQSERSRKF